MSFNRSQPRPFHELGRLLGNRHVSTLELSFVLDKLLGKQQNQSSNPFGFVSPKKQHNHSSNPFGFGSPQKQQNQSSNPFGFNVQSKPSNDFANKQQQFKFISAFIALSKYASAIPLPPSMITIG